MKEKNNPLHVSFSRVLGITDAMALAAGFLLAQLFVMGTDISKTLGSEAPLSVLIGGVLFFPVLLALMERASEVRGSANLYELSRLSYSKQLTFFTGWLILGGYICLCVLFAWGVGLRIGVGLEHMLGTSVNTNRISAAVLILTAMTKAAGFQGKWRTRTWLIGVAIAYLLFILIWSFVDHPTYRPLVAPAKPLGHWLIRITIMGTSLWFIDITLHYREQFQFGQRAMTRAMVIVWFAMTLLAATILFQMLRLTDSHVVNWAARLVFNENRMEVLLLLTNLLVCQLALSKALSRGMRVIAAMSLDGFLPRRLWSGNDKLKPPMFPLALVCVGTLTAIFLAPFSIVINMATMAALWTTALVAGSHALTRKQDLSPDRYPKLPLHPLIPAFGAGGCLLLTIIVPIRPIMVSTVWLLSGGIYYFLFGRTGSNVSPRKVFNGNFPADRADKKTYRVLLGVSDSPKTLDLIRIGVALAGAHNGELWVLRIVPSSESIPNYRLKEQSELEWQNLSQLIEDIGSRDVPIVPFVRIANRVIPGLLAAVGECHADLILLGARNDNEREYTDAPSELADIFTATSHPTAVVYGEDFKGLKNVLVAVSDGPNSPMAVELGQALSKSSGGNLTALSVIRWHGDEAGARDMLRKTIGVSDAPGSMDLQVIKGENPKAVILDTARTNDVLVLGASLDRLFHQTVTDGLAAEIIAERNGPTIVSKGAERQKVFWFKRTWNMAFNIFPTLTGRERAAVFANMVGSARAGVDFYMLITLATIIALFGLILNSGAVIIGAMLVAPLMSPMMAIAHGIVQGNLTMLREGSASTLKGITVAIGVSTVLSLIFGPYQISSEMAARTQPNLLDLIVAIASGAAGAYALSRKSVAAALPGVAISAALVPPLCVVGFGLATSRFPVSSGAMLLFLTNLSAIILSSALVFLLVGFRPRPEKRGFQLKRAVVMFILALFLLAIPLGFQTQRSVQIEMIEVYIENRIKEAAQQNDVHLDSLSIKKETDHYFIDIVLVMSQLPDVVVLETVEKEIEERVNMPVQIKLTVIPGKVYRTGAGTTPDQGNSPDDRGNKQESPES